MLLRTRKTRPWGRLPQNYLTSSRRRSGKSGSDHRLSRAATTERQARLRGIRSISEAKRGVLFLSGWGRGVNVPDAIVVCACSGSRGVPSRWAVATEVPVIAFFQVCD